MTGKSWPSAWHSSHKVSRASRRRWPKVPNNGSSPRAVRRSRARSRPTRGAGSTPTRPFFHALVDEYDASGIGNGVFRDRLESLATRATEAYASLGRFLVEEYAP